MLAHWVIIFFSAFMTSVVSPFAWSVTKCFLSWNIIRFYESIKLVNGAANNPFHLSTRHGSCDHNRISRILVTLLVLYHKGFLPYKLYPSTGKDQCWKRLISYASYQESITKELLSYYGVLLLCRHRILDQDLTLQWHIYSLRL